MTLLGVVDMYKDEIRTRTSGSHTPVMATWVTKYCDGTVVTHPSPLYSGVNLGRVSTCVDVKHQDYSRRIESGEIINSPFHVTHDERGGYNASSWKVLYTPPCSGKTIRSFEGSDRRSADVKLPVVVKDEDAFRSAASVAATAAHAGVREPEFYGVVFAAELDKTFRMLRNPLNELAKLFRELLHSRHYKTWRRKQHVKYGLSAAVSLKDYISSEWLKYRYGIMPLIYDAQGILAIANEKHQSPRMTSRGKSKLAEHGKTVIETTAPFDDGYFQGITWKKAIVETAGAFAGVLYTHEGSLQHRTGYHPEDWASSMYELIPFSFVADWFVNAGDFVRAATPKVGVKVEAEWTTTHFEVVTSAGCYATGKYRVNYLNTGSLNILSTGRYIDIIRVPQAKIELATRFHEINMGQGKWQRRAADSFALLNTLLNKGSRRALRV